MRRGGEERGMRGVEGAIGFVIVIEGGIGIVQLGGRKVAGEECGLI